MPVPLKAKFRLSSTLFYLFNFYFGTGKMKREYFMKKGTSNKPVILGTLGFLTALPNALISLLSSSFVTAYSSEPMSNSEATDYSIFYMKLIFWSALIGFLFSLFAKRFYVLAGITIITTLNLR